jgi:hypothetical protein
MKTLEKTITDYYTSWNEGFTTKDDQQIRSYMAESFVGIFGYSSIESPEKYDYHYDIVSVLNQYQEDTRKEFDIKLTTERKNGENYIITGTETSYINGEPHLAQCMYVWGLEGTEWKLLREYIEIEQ